MSCTRQHQNHGVRKGHSRNSHMRWSSQNSNKLEWLQWQTCPISLRHPRPLENVADAKYRHGLELRRFDVNSAIYREFLQILLASLEPLYKKKIHIHKGGPQEPPERLQKLEQKTDQIQNLHKELRGSDGSLGRVQTCGSRGTCAKRRPGCARSPSPQDFPLSHVNSSSAHVLLSFLSHPPR